MFRAVIAAALLLSTCNMPIQEKYGVSGLITNPNPALSAKARAGALAESHNTTHRRPGMVEPRPGFKIAYSPTTMKVLKLIPFGAGLLNVGIFNSASQRTLWEDGTQVLDENAAQLQWALDFVHGAEARGNLYLSTNDAVRKLTSGTDAAADKAGRRSVMVYTTATGTGSLYADDTRAAYRATIERTDANGVISISEPSMRSIAANASGSAKAGAVTALLTNDAIAGDVLRVYRSGVVPITVVPSDDLRLVKSIALDSTHIALGYAAFTDTVTDVDRGASLYTNPTREGLGRANFAPPRARDLALYQGSVFVGNIQYPQYVDFSMNEGGDRSHLNTGIGYRSITGTRTNGSAVISGLAENPITNGVQVGALLQSTASWSGTYVVRIVSMTSNSVTVNETWGGATDGAPVALTVMDSVKITDGSTTEYFAVDTLFDMLSVINSGTRSAGAGLTTGYRGASSTLIAARASNDALYAIDLVVQPGILRSVRLYGLLASSTSLKIAATHGDEYQPALPLISAAADADLKQDVFPEGLAWSKNSEPEHFMLGRFLRIGNKAPILRIVAAGDYLYILKGKGDGIYRLSGYGERSDWRVDQVAADVHLVHPDAAVAHEDAIYALTNKGIVMINSAGVSDPIDDPIADLTVDVGKDLSFTSPGTGTSYQARAFAEYTRDDELIFGLPKVVASSFEAVHKVYVYNISNRAWSTWLADDFVTTAVVRLSNRLLYTAAQGSSVVYVERDRATDTFPYVDRDFGITISGVSGTQITIAGGSGWTPAVGDIVYDSGSVRQSIITSVTSATVFDVLDATGLSGAATAYQAFTSTITWLPHSDPGGAARKRYSAMYLHWDDTFGVYTWSTSFSGLDGDSQSASDTFDYARASARDETRQLLNADVALQPQLYTTVAITQGDSRWRIAGMALDYREAGRRVRR